MADRRSLKDYFGGRGPQVMAGMLKAAGDNHSRAEREFFATVNADRAGSRAQRAAQPGFAPGTDPAKVPAGERTPRYPRRKT